MNRSRWLSAASVTVLVLLASLVPALTSGAEPSPSRPPASLVPGLTRQGAVDLVLASDPRFGGLPDWELLRGRTASEFQPHTLLESHYRVLPTTGEDLAIWDVAERSPRSWLISVTLVRDCAEPSPDSGPMTADPCRWRHAWHYRVQPDGEVSLLFDEGDPDDAVGLGPLVGTEWSLVAIDTYRLRHDAWLTFADDGTVSGFAGCNVFTGPYTTTGADIAIGPLRVSDRVCAPDLVMEVEGVFLEALQAAPAWWFLDDLLKIGTEDVFSPSSNKIMTFQAPSTTDG